MMQNSNDPGIESGYENDDNGTSTDTGQCGTVESGWWQTDGDHVWTDNNGNDHHFTVDDDHW